MPENSPSYNMDIAEVEKALQYRPAVEFTPSYVRDPIGNWFESITGGLTEADYKRMNEERQRDALAAQREFKANLFLDSTAMQRKVADYKAAGLNPYALGGQSVSAPSISAPASSVGAGRGASLGLSEIISLAALPSQIKSNLSGAKAADAAAQKSRADAAKADAEAKKIEEDTRGAKLQNDFFEKMRDVREEAEKLKNDLDRAERKRIYKDIDLKDSEITKNIEQAHTEQEKQGLLVQQAILANAEADNIVAMRPYIQAELSAKTQLERQQTRVAAVDEAYRQGLIDAGSIEAAVRLTNAQVSTEEANKIVKETEGFLKQYDAHRKAGDLHSWLDPERSGAATDVIDALYSGVSALTSSVLGK